MCWTLFKALCGYCSEQMETNPYTHGVGWDKMSQVKPDTNLKQRVM